MRATIERHPITGAYVASAFVTDGTDVWLETETFYGYRKRDIAELFRRSLAERDLRMTQA